MRIGRRSPSHAGDQPLVVTFGHDGRVSGTTGVNQLTASYSLTADYLTFGPLATTRRAGTPEQMEQEHRVVASLAGMCSLPALDARSPRSTAPSARSSSIAWHRRRPAAMVDAPGVDA